MSTTESSRMRRVAPVPKASNTGVLWNAVGSQPVDTALAKMEQDGWVRETTEKQEKYQTLIMKREGISATLYVSGGTVGMIRFQSQPGSSAVPVLAAPEKGAVTKTLAAVAVLKYLQTHSIATRNELQEKLGLNRTLLIEAVLLAHSLHGFRSPTGKQSFSDIQDFMLAAEPDKTSSALNTLERRAQHLRG